MVSLDIAKQNIQCVHTKNIAVVLAILVQFLPAFANAAPPHSIGDIVGRLLSFINPIIAILSGVLVLVFLWGLIRYVWVQQDSERSQITARRVIGVGIGAIFIAFSFWGFVIFLYRTLFL